MMIGMEKELLKLETVQQLKYIIRYLLSLINDPAQTWKYLTEEDVKESKPDYMQANYYLPMLGIVALLIFLMNGWGTPFNLEHAMKSAVTFLVAYFASPFLSVFLLRKTYGKYKPFNFDHDRLQVFVGYSLSFLMLVKLFSSSFPHIKFLAFCALYLFYIIWSASDVFFGIDEKDRWRFSAIAFFEIWLSPMMIERLMHMMSR